MPSPSTSVLSLAALALWALPAAPALALSSHPGWRNPVSGELARPFQLGANVYAAGAHRGVDLVARPGQPVRSACSGRVVFAGSVAGSPVVTVACGTWRATHLPVVRPRVRAGDSVGAGRVVGRLGEDDGHAGLHLGIRRADREHGYVDPWRLLSRAALDDFPDSVPAMRRRPPRRVGFRAPRGFDGRFRQPAPAATRGDDRRLAPLPVWIGLAILLAGCVGAGSQARRRRPGAPPRRTPRALALTRHVRSRTGG